MKNFILTLALLSFTAVCSAQTPYSELFVSKPVPEYKAHNDSIENSPEGRKILEKVMAETYATFAEENIKRQNNNPTIF